MPIYCNWSKAILSGKKPIGFVGEGFINNRYVAREYLKIANEFYVQQWCIFSDKWRCIKISRQEAQRWMQTYEFGITFYLKTKRFYFCSFFI